ncbi:UNVERIFIED_CONTAM: hypothetical protein GTU68_041645, partial [Idotea baltica]|nr:hypothetical protein [Idotea baltica]
LERSVEKPSCEERSSKATTPLARRLFDLIDAKKSNLCVSVDVETTQELLSLADKLGPSICLLKTHVDILKDFSSDTIDGLKSLSSKHNFLLFEDRKFSDIGNTVESQYSGGLYRIFDWAHLVTVHGISGPGVIEGSLIFQA